MRIDDGREVAPSAAPTDGLGPDNPLGSCEKGRSNWIFCLQAVVRASDDLLDQAVERVADSLNASEAYSTFQRQAFARALKEADRRFRALRDHECQALSLSEPESTGQLYDSRLICLVRRNFARIAELKARYRLAE